MSCYGWERGSIVIPSAEWAGLKSKVRDAYNARMRKRHAQALIVHAAILKAAEGKRNVDWRIASETASRTLPTSIDEPWDLINAIFDNRARGEDGRYVAPFSIKGSAGRPNKPTKAMFEEANNRSTILALQNATVTFEDRTRTIVWDVQDGNHSVDNAHREEVAIALFAALKAVRWTSSSGGEIYAENEYDRDQAREYPGGGGSRVTMRFGKAEADWRKEIASFAGKSTRGRGAAGTPSGGAFSPLGGRAWG